MSRFNFFPRWSMVLSSEHCLATTRARSPSATPAAGSGRHRGRAPCPALPRSADLAVAGQGALPRCRPEPAAGVALGDRARVVAKQCSELNTMDHLGKKLKRLMAANRQFRTIDD